MKLFFRVDASTQIGTGHVMRCLALAQACIYAGGKAVFIMATKVPQLEVRLQTEGIEIVHLSLHPGGIEDARKTATLARQFNASWIVVDGYYFGAEYQKVIKDSGLYLLFIDDYGQADYYYADIILNQNIYAHEGLYLNKQSYTQLLLGTRYILLRREFWQWREWKREIPSVANKILVTLGGADPDNVTLKVIQGLQLIEIENLEVIVVVGASNPHYQQLQTAVEQSSFLIHLKRNVTNMPELMAWADVAIAAGGTTSWELAFMGLPSLVLILADNQYETARNIGEMEVAINLGWHEDVSVRKISETVTKLLESAEMQSKMTRLGNGLVCGEGNNKVLESLQNRQIKLRQVSEDDCKLLWDWTNDPEVRSVSFSSDFISWNSHVQWFTSKLTNYDCIMYVALNKFDEPIGQVRFDIKANEATISISIDKKFRNQGYGSKLIRIATQKMFFSYDIKTINAYIKDYNYRSINSFIKAGFEKGEVIYLQGHQAISLVKNKCKSQLN